MAIREARLEQDQLLMKELSRQSSLIDFEVRGPAPDDYLVTFRCLGMINPTQRTDHHLAQIYLHAAYPRLPPRVSFLTASFHPNIAALVQMGSFQQRIQSLLAQTPDEASRQQVRQQILSDQSLFRAQVCLDTLDLNWSPDITLDVICIELGEMIQYKHYNAGDPLNAEAAAWVRQNRHLLPVDSRSLVDLKGLESIRILSEEPHVAAGEDAEIRILTGNVDG